MRMIRIAAIAAVFILVAYSVFMRVTAAAQTPACGPYAAVLRNLVEKYGERPAFIATSRQTVITITVNEKTGTWTMLAQTTPELMCFVAAGEDWGEAPESVRNPPPEGRKGSET